MTRAEATTKIIDYSMDIASGIHDNDKSFRQIVDEIYDYFESRTCGNCKWFIPHRADIPNEFEGTCDAGVCMDYDNLRYMVSIDFGCSEWEKKQ